MFAFLNLLFDSLYRSVMIHDYCMILMVIMIALIFVHSIVV